MCRRFVDTHFSSVSKQRFFGRPRSSPEVPRGSLGRFGIIHSSRDGCGSLALSAAEIQTATTGISSGSLAPGEPQATATNTNWKYAQILLEGNELPARMVSVVEGQESLYG